MVNKLIRQQTRKSKGSHLLAVNSEDHVPFEETPSSCRAPVLHACHDHRTVAHHCKTEPLRVALDLHGPLVRSKRDLIRTYNCGELELLVLTISEMTTVRFGPQILD